MLLCLKSTLKYNTIKIEAGRLPQGGLGRAGSEYSRLFITQVINCPAYEEREALTMEIDAIVSAVSTVGFPIVCCAAIFWYLYQEQKSHKEEMNAVTRALQENTLVLTELKELFTMMTGYRKAKNETRETADIQRS